MSYSKISDNQLWQLCRNNEMKAYDELFNRYYPRMLPLATRYIGSPMIAEELCMDQMFTLWDKRQQIDIQGDFSNYLFRSMRNLIISYLRKEKTVTTNLDDIIDVYQTDKSSDSNLISESINEVYSAALKALSPRRQQVFTLSRHENLTYSEIAKRMNLSVNTVENYMSAALDSLRKSMKSCLPALIIFFSLHNGFPFP